MGTRSSARTSDSDERLGQMTRTSDSDQGLGQGVADLEQQADGGEDPLVGVHPVERLHLRVCVCV